MCIPHTFLLCQNVFLFENNFNIHLYHVSVL
jgi:hypothetical protein